MKYILLLLSLSALLQGQVAVNNIKEHSSSTTKSDILVTGPCITGTSSYINKQGGQDKKRIHMLQLDVLGFPIQQAMTIDGNDVTWMFDRNEIVQFGHNSLERQTPLQPRRIYGMDYGCKAVGALFVERDQGKITTHGTGIKFHYVDPISGIPCVDVMSLDISYDPVLPFNNRVYTVKGIIKDISVAGYQDNIFSSEIFGTIQTSQRTMLAENRVEYEGTAFKYNIQAKEATTAQVVNFMNWWFTCVLPKL